MAGQNQKSMQRPSTIKKPRTFKEVSTQLPMFSLGDDEGKVPSVEGTLLAVMKDLAWAKSSVYKLRDDDGHVFGVYGFYTLDQALADVEPGSYVRLTFDGWGKSENTGREFRKVRVEVAAGEADVPF